MKQASLRILVIFLILSSAGTAYALAYRNSAELNVKETEYAKATSTKILPLKRPADTKTGMEEPGNMKKEMKGEMKDAREKMASSTEKRGEMMKRYSVNVFDKTASRLLATIEREEIIMAKILARIERIKADGGKTTEAEKLVAEAKVHFAEARVALETFKTLVNNTPAAQDTVSTSTITKETLTNVRKVAKEIDKHLREGHKALQKTIGILRGVSELHNATSTKEN